MAQIPYPTEFPLSEIQRITSALRDGSVATNKDQFGKDAWTVAGFALGLILGEPHVVKSSALEESSFIGGSELAALNDLLEAAEEHSSVAKAGAFDPAIWAIVTQLIQLVVQLINALKKPAA